MFLPGRLYRPLAQLDDRAWQTLLEAHEFWRAPGYSPDEEHQDIAFHILLSDGELARTGAGR